MTIKTKNIILAVITGLLFCVAAIAADTVQYAGKKILILDNKMRNVTLNTYNVTGSDGKATLMYQVTDSSGQPLFENNQPVLSQYTKTTFSDDGTPVTTENSGYLRSDQQRAYIADQRIQEAKNNANQAVQNLLDKFKNTQTPQPSTDHCLLITPGMSKINGNIYGQPYVRAKNDKHEYLKELLPKCETVRPEKPAPKLKDVQDIAAETCVYAVDYAGLPATQEAANGGKEAGDESQLNFEIRKIQKQENVDPFAVTTDKDLQAITGTGANKEIHEGTKDQGKSQETIDKENIKVGKIIRTVTPSKEQHEEYYKSSKETRGYTVDGFKMTVGSKYIAGQTGYSSAGNKSEEGDVDVTNECIFKAHTGKTPLQEAQESKGQNVPASNKQSSISQPSSPSVASYFVDALSSFSNSMFNSIASLVSEVFTNAS